MARIFLWAFCLVLAVSAIPACGGGSEHGPQIYVDRNVRAITGIPVSAVVDPRCKKGDNNTCNPACSAGTFCAKDPDDNEAKCAPDCNPACGTVDHCVCKAGTGCTQTECVADTCDPATLICVTPDPAQNFYTGHCRQCRSDANCQAGFSCDHGWCHKTCTTSSDCDGVAYCSPGGPCFCTAGFCRLPANSVDITLTNKGDRDLEIYTDQVALHGHDDACSFHLGRMLWSPSEPTIRLTPNGTAFMRLRFTPPEAGAFRALLTIPNNDPDPLRQNLPFMLCGQAVEYICDDGKDVRCPDHMSCDAKDFEGFEALTPDCSAFQ